MEYFVDENSIVRRIWGDADTIFLIFGGAAAEFALSKAVDWLYFTGRLPADPLNRMFSTVEYAKAIVFSKRDDAYLAIDAMSRIHASVEANRGASIPDWAYRDVLFMLIDYSIRSFEVLERKLTETEKEEVFRVFNQVGHRMGINGLPDSFNIWTEVRHNQLETNFELSDYTNDLFKQYRKHLGIIRFRLLIEAQILIAPAEVRKLLKFRKFSLLRPLIGAYKISQYVKLDLLLKALILPAKYKKKINSLNKTAL